MTIPYPDAQDEKENLREELKEAKELLKAMEWSTWNDDGLIGCPCCEKQESKGHSKDCKLAQILKDA